MTQFYITEFMSTASDGCAMLFRTDDMIKWLDRIQELKKTRHIRKSRACFFLQIRDDGSAHHFFTFSERPLYRKKGILQIPFVKQPAFIWLGFPEGDIENE